MHENKKFNDKIIKKEKKFYIYHKANLYMIKNDYLKFVENEHNLLRKLNDKELLKEFIKTKTIPKNHTLILYSGPQNIYYEVYK